mgnify:FL=1
MIALKQIEYLLPKNKLLIKKRYRSVSNLFLKEKIGATKLPRFSEKDTVINICTNLIKKKIAIDEFKKKVGALILCTQNPDFNGLPHNSSVIHYNLGLSEKVACFDISQGCAGYLYGIVASQSFLKKGQFGLLLTCDPYSKIILKNDFSTNILFGDAASITVLKKDGAGKKLIDYEFFSYGKDYEVIINRNGLKMDGKKVMKFCTTIVPSKIKNFLKKNNLTIDSIDQFYFHQGSKYIVDQICYHLKIPKSAKAPVVKNIGNTVSSTLPILMRQYDYKKKKNILICGFGVGLSVSIGLIV